MVWDITVPYYKMPKTTEEKKQQEMKRQEVLLKHATYLYMFSGEMDFNWVDIVKDNVEELMSVTKINKDLAIKYMNKTTDIDDGNDRKAVFYWCATNKRIEVKLYEKCEKCRKFTTVVRQYDENGDPADDHSHIKHRQEFYDRDVYNYGYTVGTGHNHEVILIGKRMVYGLCADCMPKDVYVGRNELPEDVEPETKEHLDFLYQGVAEGKQSVMRTKDRYISPLTRGIERDP